MAKERLYESASVWDQPLQAGQRKLIQAIFDHWPDGVRTALDVGCGDGKITQALANLVETSFHGLDGSREALSRLGLPSAHGDVSALPFIDRAFDLVLTTDVFEHLPDAAEHIAWSEVFRVARDWVVVAVPFREELLDAATVCKNCGHHYHVNWHRRAYDLADFSTRAPAGWVLAATILSGEPWTPRLPPETNVRRLQMREWSGWSEAICPECGAAGHAPAPSAPLPADVALALGRRIYAAAAEQRFVRSHTEIIAVFGRAGLAVKTPASTPDTEQLSAARWISRLGLAENLDPYPQAARMVATGDGGCVAQFPVYPASLPQLRCLGSRAQTVTVKVEDGAGVLFNGAIELSPERPTEITLPRDVRAGYHGLLVRVRSAAPFASITFEGAAPSIRYLFPAEGQTAYYAIPETTTRVQVAQPLWIDLESLVAPAPSSHAQAAQHAATPPRTILMLCHDQRLDRRIVAQAQSLISNGCRVTLLALSFDQGSSRETTPEGIDLVRVGLANIVPENRIYRGYMRLQRGLSRLRNLAGRRLSFLDPGFNAALRLASAANRRLYRAALLLAYRNRAVHDPLPFRSAFVNAAAGLEGDIIQVHDLPTLEAGVELARARNLPLVYDAHELYPEQKSFSARQRRICSNAEARLIKHADLVFAVNESIGRDMARRYAIDMPRVLSNALDPPVTFDPSVKYDLLREKIGLGQGRRILLFQGGFAPNRNLENLVAAFSKLATPDVDLVLMGFGWFEDALRAIARKHGVLDRRVFFVPAVPQSELLQHTASADMGIIPYPHCDLNSYLCTPNKLFEFIQAGLPILANQSPELERVVLANGFGLTAKMENPRQIADAIDRAFAAGGFGDWRSALQMGRTRFTWRAQERGYLEPMAALLERQPAPRRQTDVDRAEHVIDSQGVPSTRIAGAGDQRHPAWIAIHALAYSGKEVYDDRLAGLADSRKFQACIDWLEQNLRQDDRRQWVWQYHFDSTYNDISIHAPWSSAFAQATGIQALIAAHERSGDSRYLELARKASQPLLTPLAAGGFLYEAGDDIWFQEIPEPAANPGHILNGHMRVLLALADLHKATNDAAVAAWFERGTRTLYRWLPGFDAGYWLRYDLNPRKAELLFRFADPYGFPNHALAVDKITLRDPVSKAELSVDVGRETDTRGAARIAGTHWGPIEQLAGRSVRRLAPAALDDTPDAIGAPHTYFYLSLPGEWQDNLRRSWFELIVDYYDDAAASITVQQRSIAPGKTFRDLRDGDLLLTGSGEWRRWILPIRPSDLGYWVGAPYAEKHAAYLRTLAQFDPRLSQWATVAAGYLRLAQPVQRKTPNIVRPEPLSLPRQTPPLPTLSLDANGVLQTHAWNPRVRLKPDGRLDPSGDPGTPTYSPYVVAHQLLSGEKAATLDDDGGVEPRTNRRVIERQPALNWLLNPQNFAAISSAHVYRYPFDNAYNDVATSAPWPSAFGQAYVLKALTCALAEGIGDARHIAPAVTSAVNAFRVSLAQGGIVATDRTESIWFEEVPNGSHILNAHLVAIPELAVAAQATMDRAPRILADQAICALRDKLYLFDTGYWLRYDLNPRKELLLQLDWIEGENSPLIDEVLLENPQTGHQVLLNVGGIGDAKGAVRLSGSEWHGRRIVDGRMVRAFSNGYRIRAEPAAGLARHNVFLKLQLPDRAFADAFDVPSHRLIIRYKDTSMSLMAVKIQAIHQGKRLTFAPLRGGAWTLHGDQRWKEAVFTIRPQDMGWYKGPEYQKYEVEQLQRIYELTGDWFFSQYAERQRSYLTAQH